MKTSFRSGLFLVSFLVTAVMSSTHAWARSIDPTPVVAIVTGEDNGVTQAALLADGRLQIVKTDSTVQTVVLPKQTAQRLLGLAYRPANAKLKTTPRLVVCAMMPPPELRNLEVSGFDSSTGRFNSKMRLVQTDENCSVTTVVTPDLQDVREDALQLKAALATLAPTLVK